MKDSPRRRYVLAAAAALGAASCAKAPRPAPPPPRAAPTEARPTRALRAEVMVPEEVTFDSKSLGPAGAFLTIKLVNDGSTQVVLGTLRVRLTAKRAGVSFPCDPDIGPDVGVREPGVLRAGRTFTFRRNLGCSMPVPGDYEIEVDAVADEPLGLARPLARLPVHVEPSKTLNPKPIPGHAGAFVLLTGNPVARATSAAGTGPPDYSVVLAFVNASPAPIRLGPAGLALGVRRRDVSGEPRPVPGCGEQRARITPPGELAPGMVHVTRTQLACLPPREGQYDIAGALTFEASGAPIDVGPVDLRITADPRLFQPVPVP